MTPDSWHHLRQHTAARIALGHAGVSLPTSASLAFRLAHAQARDAVFSELQSESLRDQLAALGAPWVAVRSRVRSRDEYLKNPGSGRRLSEDDALRLQTQSTPCELCIVIGDGLSAAAVNEHALPLLRLLSCPSSPDSAGASLRSSWPSNVGSLSPMRSAPLCRPKWCSC